MNHMSEFGVKVLAVADQLGVRDSLFIDDEDHSILVNCNDFFFWGCADAQEITPKNLPEFEKACADIKSNGPLLFCARVRKMRPQGAVYGLLMPEEIPLFNACGPHREEDILNPTATPE